MLFPIGDTNVRGGYKPLFSYSFIALNIIIFLLQLNTSGHLVCAYATIPNVILKGDQLHTLVSSMFLHGGWMHLIGNMLFLWVFGDNIEAIMGNIRFLIFYLLGGLFATFAHIAAGLVAGSPEMASCCEPCVLLNACETASSACPGSIPSLGASGAISAVLGAYIVFFPKSRIKVLIFFFVTTVPAVVFLGLWFVEQLISGVGSMGPLTAQTAGVAWWAHIGGFIFGLIYGWINKDFARGVYIVRD